MPGPRTCDATASDLNNILEPSCSSQVLPMTNPLASSAIRNPSRSAAETSFTDKALTGRSFRIPLRIASLAVLVVSGSAPQAWLWSKRPTARSFSCRHGARRFPAFARRNPPDSVANVVSHEQGPLCVQRDANGTTHRVAVRRQETAQKILGWAGRRSIDERHEYYFIPGARLAVP